jgi:DNA-binding transcriptional ArsR family regulator
MRAEPIDDLDDVWRALSNPARRRMLDLLTEGPVTTGELAACFPELSRFAVMQHLKVLEKADLVVPRRSGRERHNYLNPVPVQQIYERWVSRFMRPWTDALTSLKHELEEHELEEHELEEREADGA